MKKNRNDVLTPAQRSFCMSQIKSKDTVPELYIKGILKALKVPFKSNYNRLMGRPDIYIKPLNLVVEIRGCFWHGHENCKFFAFPKTNKIYWKNKIKGNISRDKLILSQLKKSGLKICIVWECEIKNGSFLGKILTQVNKQAQKLT